MPGNIESEVPPRTSDSRAQEIRAYLAQLLASRQFAAASRRGQLLEYLVNRTLEGDADKISEYAIGLEVFQRPPSFDPRIESLVRTEVSRLRQRLREYYAEDGMSDPIVIDLPQRSYIVSFEFREVDNAAEPEAIPTSAPATAKSQNNRLWWISAAAGLVLIAGGGFLLYRQHPRSIPAKMRIDSIVVLPFADYTPNHQDDYISDGITEELTNDLAQWRDLRVVARTSAFAFKGKNEDVRQIGHELNVDAVLEGSFARQGDEVRVTAQLNRTSDGFHLWSHSYQSNSKDLMGLQQQVADAIAAEIGQVRGGSPPVMRVASTNPKAHDLYLQGVYQFNLQTPESLLNSIQLLRQATVEDPSFARAYLSLALAEGNAATLSVMTNQEVMPHIRQTLQKAIDLDPSLGNAYGTLAFYDYTLDWDWPRADAEFQRAIERGAGADTHSRYGWALATRGRFAESHEQFKLATEQDPLSFAPPLNEFFVYNFERDVAGQKRTLDRVLQLKPNFLGALILEVAIATQQHDCATARSDANLMAKIYPTLSATQGALGMAAGCENDKPEALRRIKQMIAMKAQAWQVAIVYALIHDTDNVIAQLNKSADAREGQILYLRYNPFFDEIRSDPRFISLEKRVGLL